MPTIVNKAAILLEWLPIYPLIMSVIDAKAGQSRAVAVTNTLKFVAARTPFKCDDELVALVEKIVLTDQGAALINYLAAALHESLKLKEDSTDGI